MRLGAPRFTDLRDRLRLERPILQAGMAGGLATAVLAAAVSRGGGLGAIGLQTPKNLAAQIRRARALAPGRPIAANLLLPFVFDAHVDVCIAERVEAVILFFGFSARTVARLRDAGIAVLHQVGTVDQVRQAVVDGADGIIAQGGDSGGHLMGTKPALEFLPHALEAAAGRPVVLAGGVAHSADVREALARGAAAVLCGSRFLLTAECRAHAEYKRRVLAAPRTIETTLFGLGWPVRHRVVPNAATSLWCAPDGSPRWTIPGALDASGPGRRRRSTLPLFNPKVLLDGADPTGADASPLYAGTSTQRMTTIVPAEQAVRDLAP